MMREITIVVEDDLHLNIAKKVINRAAPSININRILGKRGSSYIRNNLKSFNQAANVKYYVVILDLDLVECAPLLLEDIITFKQNKDLLLNVAVREAETWLLADRKRMAAFLGIAESKIRREVEEIQDPKNYLIRLASHSKYPPIRRALIPEGGAKVGRLYNSTLEEFIREKWDINSAMKNSRSLSRFVAKIKNISI
jgi:hypothetical protein